MRMKDLIKFCSYFFIYIVTFDKFLESSERCSDEYISKRQRNLSRFSISFDIYYQKQTGICQVMHYFHYYFLIIPAQLYSFDPSFFAICFSLLNMVDTKYFIATHKEKISLKKTHESGVSVHERVLE